MSSPCTTGIDAKVSLPSPKLRRGLRLTLGGESPKEQRTRAPADLLCSDATAPQTWPDPYHHETSPKPVFTAGECSEIVRVGMALSRSPASVKAGTATRRRRWVRNASVAEMARDERTDWIFAKIMAGIDAANSARWHYELLPVGRLQFIEYGSGGHYIWHVDVGPGVNITRKLSFSVQLSAPGTYWGGKLQFLNGYSRRTASKELGSLTVFPSFMLHRVKPVLRGTRYSLVGWVHGARPLR